MFIYAWPIPPDVYFWLSYMLEVLMIAEWVVPTGLGGSTSNTAWTRWLVVISPYAGCSGLLLWRVIYLPITYVF